MSQDARNSIYLWISVLTFVGLFWAGLQFNLLGDMSDTWIWPLIGAVAVIDFARLAWGFWKRRASSPDNPNQRQP